MVVPFVNRLRLDGFLSFAPDSEPIDLLPLNVLIGPNGSGKSNFIEAFELLRATPTDLAGAIRDGGGPDEWTWKGDDIPFGASAKLNVTLAPQFGFQPQLEYQLSFHERRGRPAIGAEAINEVTEQGSRWLYKFKSGHMAMIVEKRTPGEDRRELNFDLSTLATDQSILSQRKDPVAFPELTWIGQEFGAIQTFREWTFGRYSKLRRPQRADMPGSPLLPNSLNLSLVLNEIEHRDGSQKFNNLLKHFFPRFERMSTLVSGGTVQFYLHEDGFSSPIPPSRISDGTMRFIALLATLLAPNPPPLVCIEEPELGLHPDAMTLIAELLKEASQRMQLIVTTHSDALVSALSDEPNSIVTCERLGAGTSLRRIDPEKLAHWLDKYRLGDLWRMGELGANP